MQYGILIKMHPIHITNSRMEIKNMKIRFNRHELAAAIAPLMSCVSTKVTVPAAEGILIEAKYPDVCILTTFDLEKGMRVKTHAQVIEEGTYIINAVKLNQTLRVMPADEIELDVDSRNVASIVCGKSSHKMNALAGSDFPAIPSLDSEDAFTVKQNDLREMFSQTMYAMGINDQRNILNGTFVKMVNDQLTMVSCDNFKLAKCERTVEYNTDKDYDGTFRNAFILPVKTVNELAKLLSDNKEKTTRVFLTRKNIVFEIGEIVFFSRLIEGEYLDYDRIIIKNHKYSAELNREELISALERAALVTEEKIAGSLRSHVKLIFDGNLLKITANSSAGSTYDEIEINDIGAPLTIGFNNRYLINSVKACNAERIKLSLSSHLSSLNIVPAEAKDGIDEVFMLLPVRLKD